VATPWWNLFEFCNGNPPVLTDTSGLSAGAGAAAVAGMCAKGILISAVLEIGELILFGHKPSLCRALVAAIAGCVEGIAHAPAAAIFIMLVEVALKHGCDIQSELTRKWEEAKAKERDELERKRKQRDTARQEAEKAKADKEWEARKKKYGYPEGGAMAELIDKAFDKCIAACDDYASTERNVYYHKVPPYPILPQACDDPSPDFKTYCKDGAWNWECWLDACYHSCAKKAVRDGGESLAKLHDRAEQNQRARAKERADKANGRTGEVQNNVNPTNTCRR